MRTRFTFLSALFLLLAGQVIFAQVTGTVEDADGFPLADAQISVRGTDASAVTDENGAFSVDAQVGDVLIITDLMGTTQEFNIPKTKLGTLKFGAPVTLTEVTLVGGIKMETGQKLGANTIVRKKILNWHPWQQLMKFLMVVLQDYLFRLIVDIQVAPILLQFVV